MQRLPVIDPLSIEYALIQQARRTKLTDSDEGIVDASTSLFMVRRTIECIDTTTTDDCIEVVRIIAASESISAIRICLDSLDGEHAPIDLFERVDLSHRSFKFPSRWRWSLLDTSRAYGLCAGESVANVPRTIHVFE